MIAAPPPPVLAEGARLRRRLAAGGPLGGAPIGTVPILWNNVDIAELRHGTSAAAILDDIARIGFDGCQLGLGFPEGEDLRAALNDRNLRLAEVYASIPATVDGPTAGALEEVRERIRLLAAGGGEVLCIAFDGSPDRDAFAGRAADPATPRLTDDGWARTIALLETAAAETRAAGGRIAFHPHAGTYIETPAEVERLAAAVDAASLPFCLDVGHYLVGGGDPVAALRQYGERVEHVHLKDVDPEVLAGLRDGSLGGFGAGIRARLFTELGSGALDLDGVLAALAARSYDGWLMVEQDSGWPPPAESAAIGRRVLAAAIRRMAGATAGAEGGPGQHRRPPSGAARPGRRRRAGSGAGRGRSPLAGFGHPPRGRRPRSARRASPGPSRTSDAAAAASSRSNPWPIRPPTRRGSIRAAASAARNTSPAPVGSTGGVARDRRVVAQLQRGVVVAVRAVDDQTALVALGDGQRRRRAGAGRRGRPADRARSTSSRDSPTRSARRMIGSGRGATWRTGSPGDELAQEPLPADGHERVARRQRPPRPAAARRRPGRGSSRGASRHAAGHGRDRDRVGAIAAELESALGPLDVDEDRAVLERDEADVDARPRAGDRSRSPSPPRSSTPTIAAGRQAEPGGRQRAVGDAAAEPPAARVVVGEVAGRRADDDDGRGASRAGVRSSARSRSGHAADRPGGTACDTGRPSHPLPDRGRRVLLRTPRGRRGVFSDVLLARDDEMDPDEFFELVESVRRRIQDTYDGRYADRGDRRRARARARLHLRLRRPDHRRGQRVDRSTRRTSSSRSTRTRRPTRTSAGADYRAVIAEFDPTARPSAATTGATTEARPVAAAPTC